MHNVLCIPNEIDSLESIPGLHKRLQIWAQDAQLQVHVSLFCVFLMTLKYCRIHYFSYTTMHAPPHISIQARHDYETVHSV